MIVLLDAAPLGMITNPMVSPLTAAANVWLTKLLATNTTVLVPEIADYEVRRELLRAGKMASLQRLDALKQAIGYLALTTAMMLTAADFWARARQQGTPTAADKALDGDMILAAQAHILARRRRNQVVIATTNVKHLSLFADAREWQKIP